MMPGGRRTLVLALGALIALMLAGCLRVRSDDPAATGRPVAAAQFAGPTGTPDPATTATAVPATSATAVSAATATIVPSVTGEPGTPAPSATPTALVSATARPTVADPYPLLFPRGDGRDEEDGAERDEGTGGRANVVRLANRTSGQLRIKGRVQLNRIPGDEAKPVNQAIAYSSCSDCQTFSIALQLDLISKTAHTIAPENSAIAVNYKCSHCVTVARAVQYVRQVDDPRETPDDVKDMVERLNDELQRIHDQQRRLTAAQAESRINAIVDRFNAMAQGRLDDRREHDEKDDHDR